MNAVTQVKDFVKDQRELYVPGGEPVIVDVPEMLFLMIDGQGAPDPEQGTAEHLSEFQAAFGALYGLIYSIKMSEKKGEQPEGYYNFKVPPPEALWWMEGGQAWDMNQRDYWRWTLMIRVPEYVTPRVVQQFAEELIIKKKSFIYLRVRLESYKEGKAVQLTHVGSYETEGPNIQKMRKFAQDQGYKLHGKHHEIYFGDPRRTAPGNLHTVLRQPIAR